MNIELEDIFIPYFYELQIDGTIWRHIKNIYDDLESKKLNQGNLFLSMEDAELERDRRNLLFRFSIFRDFKNRGWMPDWKKWSEPKYCIYWNGRDLLPKLCDTNLDFNIFGYFKNRDYCLAAISEFGNEIMKLYVEVD